MPRPWRILGEALGFLKISYGPRLVPFQPIGLASVCIGSCAQAVIDLAPWTIKEADDSVVISDRSIPVTPGDVGLTTVQIRQPPLRSEADCFSEIGQSSVVQAQASPYQTSAVVGVYMIWFDLKRGRAVCQSLSWMAQGVLSDGTRKVNFSLAQAQPDGCRAIRHAASMVLSLAVNKGTDGMAEGQIRLGVKHFLTFGQGCFKVAAAHTPQFYEAEALFGARERR